MNSNLGYLKQLLESDFTYKSRAAHVMLSVSLSIETTSDSSSFEQRLSESRDEACVPRIKTVGSRYLRVIICNLGFYIRDLKADC